MQSPFARLQRWCNRKALLGLGVMVVPWMSACAQVSAPPAEVTQLLASIEHRLALAKQVALNKWDTGKPVEDRARERQVIDNARASAVDRKIDPEWAEQFFAAQIEANKLFQYARLDAWTRAGKAPDEPRKDLAKDIRPVLDQLQDELLQRMAAFAPYRTSPDCRRWMTSAIPSVDESPLRNMTLLRATAGLCVSGG